MAGGNARTKKKVHAQREVCTLDLQCETCWFLQVNKDYLKVKPQNRPKYQAIILSPKSIAAIEPMPRNIPKGICV